MPTAPLHRCLGAKGQHCPTLVKGTRCAACEKGYDQRRGTAQERGYTKKWHRARSSFLRRPENVLCVECRKAGRRIAATLVDHVTPHRGNDQLFWDESNWQAMCASCHGRKPGEGRFGR